MRDKALSFSFKYVTWNKIAKEIQNLDSKKACQESVIPVKLIKKKRLRCYFSFLSTITLITLYSVSSELKNANVTPVFLKKINLM